MENIYADALEAMLRDHCSPAVVRNIEAGADASVLWQRLDASGFADSLLADAGLSLQDLLPMLWVTGKYAVPLPLAQTIFARGLLQSSGVPIPAGPIALASFEGQARALVADAAAAQWFLAQDRDKAWLVRRDAADVAATGVHGDLTVSMACASDAAFALPSGTLRTVGAALHAAQMAGAMARVFDMTLQYANDREQFGRAIGKFQAIQHQISLMAEHVALVRMAAQIGFSGEGTQPHRMHAAIAKCNASEAVTPITSIAHAVHGAIGITEEYDLQCLTRRLHAWRLADGSERYWAREIGDAACDTDGGAVDIVRMWSGEAG